MINLILHYEDYETVLDGVVQKRSKDFVKLCIDTLNDRVDNIYVTNCTKDINPVSQDMRDFFRERNIELIEFQYDFCPYNGFFKTMTGVQYLEKIKDLDGINLICDVDCHISRRVDEVYTEKVLVDVMNGEVYLNEYIPMEDEPDGHLVSSAIVGYRADTKLMSKLYDFYTTRILETYYDTTDDNFQDEDMFRLYLKLGYIKEYKTISCGGGSRSFFINTSKTYEDIYGLCKCDKIIKKYVIKHRFKNFFRAYKY